jgi:hypothetical protein
LFLVSVLDFGHSLARQLHPTTHQRRWAACAPTPESMFCFALRIPISEPCALRFSQQGRVIRFQFFHGELVDLVNFRFSLFSIP